MMKTYLRSAIWYLSLLFVLLPLSAPAHGDDDHTLDAKSAAERSQSSHYFSTEVSSEKYELLLRYEPIQPGVKTTMTLFVSEYATNKPVNDARFTLTAKEDSSIVFTLHPHGAGTYEVEAVFPKAIPYAVIVQLDGALGADLLLIQNIEVGRELDPANDTDHDHSGIFQSGLWVYLILALLLGGGLGFLMSRRNTSKGRTSISVILMILGFSIPFQSTIAHGDEDHFTTGAGQAFSGHLHIPKETQFLFDINTQQMVRGNFAQSTKLFGTIVPSSNGQTVVSTPQSGIIGSIRVQVGMRVQAGQVLAVVEQNMDAGTRINMLAERNNLEAEYDAASKDMQRLRTIQDIAAKKDLDEAQARFQKADQNLKLFNSNTGKSITLRSPIQGVVGNFSTASGSTVNAGQSLFTITNLSTLYVEAQVFDRDASKIVKDAVFTIECANDCHTSGRVRLLSYAQEINSTNQSQRVLFEVDNPEGEFKIGEFVNIRVFDTTTSRQISVPNSAITEISGKPVVFVKEAAEAYTPVYVQTGDDNGSFTSILKGLEEGQRVVTHGSYQMKMIYLNP